MASFSLETGAVQNKRNRVSAPIPKDFALDDPGPLLHGQFEINGIRFPVDPQRIHINEENFNHKCQTLRTRESTKVRSGHSRLSINVSALFTGISVGNKDSDNSAGRSLGEINDTLMPILYSLKKFPLCFIDNELIRRNLPVRSWEDEDGNLVGENIGAFVKMVNIATVPGMPHTISAEFQFVWYNHRPFAPNLLFRRNWVDDREKVIELQDLYKASSDRISENSSLQAQGIGQTTGGEIARGHPGRKSFIDSFGHPSVAFNATAIHSYTDNIHEARPFLEWMFPYKYESSNPLITPGQEAMAIKEFAPFDLDSFGEEIEFGFTALRTPDANMLAAIGVLNDSNLSKVQEDAIKEAEAKLKKQAKARPAQTSTWALA